MSAGFTSQQLTDLGVGATSDSNVKPWQDAATPSKYWFCSADDVVLFQVTGSTGVVFDQRFNTLLRGVGHDSNAKSANGDKCCADNTYGTSNLECLCIAGTVQTNHYSQTVGTATDDKNLACKTCTDIIAAKTTEKYNNIALETVLKSGATTLDCDFATNYNNFGYISKANLNFRCKSTVDPVTNTISAAFAMKCNKPSLEAQCTEDESLTCEDCTKVVAPTSGLKLGAVSGSCGCTSNCNDDKSCVANAILNTNNQCECMWTYIGSFVYVTSAVVETCEAVSYQVI